jgi:predicted GIY-YIG superfamily endonuclease
VAVAYTEPQKSKSAALKREAALKKLTRRVKTTLIAAGLTKQGRRVVSLPT